MTALPKPAKGPFSSFDRSPTDGHDHGPILTLHGAPGMAMCRQCGAWVVVSPDVPPT